MDLPPRPRPWRRPRCEPACSRLSTPPAATYCTRMADRRLAGGRGCGRGIPSLARRYISVSSASGRTGRQPRTRSTPSRCPPGTIPAVNHTRHVWGQWHGNFVLGFPLDAAGIRAEIANGQLNVVGSTELNGQQAVELEITLPPSNEAPPHVTTARLWVDATTYLPMQQFLRLSDGEQNVTDYTFLAPTAENLAKLRPEIPAGYTQAGYTQAGYAQVTGPQPKTK